MSSKQQCVKLNDGHFIPALGFGTYKPKEVRIQDSQNFQARANPGTRDKDVQIVRFALHWGLTVSPLLVDCPC